MCSMRMQLGVTYRISKGARKNGLLVKDTFKGIGSNHRQPDTHNSHLLGNECVCADQSGLHKADSIAEAGHCADSLGNQQAWGSH